MKGRSCIEELRRERACMKKAYIDLHLHLDGAITAPIAMELAEEQGISLPAGTQEELEKLISVPKECGSLNDFLKCFELPLSLLQTREGIRRAVRLVLEEQQREGVIYAEIRFSPQLHTRKGLSQEEALRAALEGLQDATIPANLILACMRGADNQEENEENLELARRFLTKDGGVTAVDLAGAEALFPTRDYIELFRKARVNGIPITIHAGEADGADSVRAAIAMGAVRIGHGVRIWEDPEVLEEIRSRGITLEMCPTSNWCTRSIEKMEDYPLISYLQKGIRVTVNTDDPAIEGTTIVKEFQRLREQFGLTGEQERVLLQNAAEAAFTTQERKEKLRSSVCEAFR